MPLQGRPVSGNFDQAAFNFIHGNEGFVDTPYLDSVGVPTIGYGYALLSRSKNGVYSVSQSALQADFAGIHTFTTAEINLLQNIATDLTAHNLAGAKALFNNRNADTLSFTITPADGVTLFNEKLNRLVSLFIPSDIRTNLAGTYELVALEDMAYNGGGALFGANMLKALRESDPIQSRLDTWYQIVFASNGGTSANVGIENRRLREASEFGLYSNGNQPSQTDKGKEALRVALYLSINILNC
jgi:GH24 family phage-related lysozyme (muramidase)